MRRFDLRRRNGDTNTYIRILFYLIVCARVCFLRFEL